MILFPQVMRRQLVTDVFRGVFPIEVEPLSEADAGEEGEWWVWSVGLV